MEVGDLTSAGRFNIAACKYTRLRAQGAGQLVLLLNLLHLPDCF